MRIDANLTADQIDVPGVVATAIGMPAANGGNAGWSALPFRPLPQFTGRIELDAETAAWMASNLRREDDGLVWALDWTAMEALLRDFFARDFWGVVEAPPPGVALHFIKATESSRLSEAACARLEAAARASGRVHLHRVPGGHWVHTDNPEAVTALLADALP